VDVVVVGLTRVVTIANFGVLAVSKHIVVVVSQAALVVTVVVGESVVVGLMTDKC
jgi:hypothetical protein